MEETAFATVFIVTTAIFVFNGINVAYGVTLGIALGSVTFLTLNRIRTGAWV